MTSTHEYDFELVLMVGLPYSGKSTVVREDLLTIPNSIPAVIAPDAFRLALHGQRFIPSAEGLVWEIARVALGALVRAGHQTIIIDACNQSFKRRKAWIDVARKSGPCRVVAHVLETPYLTCHERITADQLLDEGLLDALAEGCTRMSTSWDAPDLREGIDEIVMHSGV